jgi:hypothetical protein
MLRVGLVSLLVTLACARAEAQSRAPTPSDTQLAAAHFQTGMAEYRAGHFQRAAAEFRAAYEQSHDVALLFNVGSALFDGGDLAGAETAFNEYLRVQPDAPNRAIIEGRLATIRQRLATESSSSPPPASGAPAVSASSAPPSGAAHATAPTARPFPVLPIAVAGVGVLGLAASGLFYGLRVAALSGCTEQPDAFVCATSSAASNASTFGVATEVSLAIGGVVLLGGLTWLLIDRLTESPSPRVTASAGVSKGSGFVLAGATF